MDIKQLYDLDENLQASAYTPATHMKSVFNNDGEAILPEILPFDGFVDTTTFAQTSPTHVDGILFDTNVNVQCFVAYTTNGSETTYYDNWVDMDLYTKNDTGALLRIPLENKIYIYELTGYVVKQISEVPPSYKLVTLSGSGDGTYDVSANNDDITFTSLLDLFSNLNLNDLIPTNVRKGGMSIKFILTTPASYDVVKTEGLDSLPIGIELSEDPNVDNGTYTADQLDVFYTLPTSTGVLNAITYWFEVTGDVITYISYVITLTHSYYNKYVQYRLMTTSFDTTESNWQGVDDEPMDGSENLVKSGGILSSTIGIVNSTVARVVNSEKERAESVERNLQDDIDTIKNVTNFPDEEDLTTVNQEGTNVLKFKDKVHNELAFSGFGRKYLRKNIQEIIVSGQNITKNILTQEMIPLNDENVIYYIQYDYDLNGASIQIPNNCVLKFEGGSLKNGTVVGNNTIIDASLVEIFGNNINFSGSFSLDKVYPEWFGAKGLYNQSSNEATLPTIKQIGTDAIATDLEDSSMAFNKAFNLAKFATGVVYCLRVIYRIEQTVVIPWKCTLLTQEETIFDVRMEGSGTNKIVQDPNTSNFSTSIVGNAISLAANEFFAPDSMAVAFEIGSVKTELIGKGTICLVKSNHTIGIHIIGTGYQKLDMSYGSPYIDIRTVGDRDVKVVPDTRDLFGDEDPASELGNDGQFYYNTSANTYWKKSNGNWTRYQSSYDNTNLFNVSLRLNVGSGWSSGRIICPHISIWDMYGWRGIEIYTHDGGWCNEGYWNGTVSNKHGSFVSIYTDYDVGQHRFDITEQLDGQVANDARGFYAIRCGAVTTPRTYDLTWANPERASSEFYYLGYFTKSCTINSESGFRFLKNLSNSNNNHNINIQNYSQTVSATAFFNLFENRTPDNASLAAFGEQSYRLLHQSCSDVNDAYSKWGSESEISIPKLLFDGDVSSFVSVVDTSNGIYGFGLKFARTQTVSVVSNAYIELEYLTSSVDTKNIHIGIWSQPAIYATTEVCATSNNSYTVKTRLPLVFGQSNDYIVFMYTTSNAENQKVNLFAIRFWVNGIGRNIYPWEEKRLLTNKTFGKLSYIPNAPNPGFMYFDTTNNRQLINVGTSEQPIWNPIPNDGLGKAILINANPGTDLEWKDTDGNIRTSKEYLIEANNVKILSANLFKDNINLKGIKSYPIRANNDISNAFDGCSNLEYIDYLYTGNVTKMNYLFKGCTKLKVCPNLDTHSLQAVYEMFKDCTSLETVPLLNWSKINSGASYAFKGCTNLENLGGFHELKLDLYLRDSNKLTRESMLNVFNELATITTNQRIIISTTTNALLSDEDKAIATDKGWRFEVW